MTQTQTNNISSNHATASTSTTWTRMNKCHAVLAKWEDASQHYIKQPLLRAVVAVALFAARHPIQIVVGTILISVTFIVAGLYTNFRIVVDGPELWAPVGTQTVKQGNWVQQQFEKVDPAFHNKGYLAFIVHAEGSNVLTLESTNCLFDVIETIRNVDGYHATCYDSWGTQDQECPILSATSLFDQNRSFVDRLVRLAKKEQRKDQNETKTSDISILDKIVQYSMSRTIYPSGASVVRPVIFGYPEEQPDVTNSNETVLVSAKSYLGFIPKSEKDNFNFEKNAVEALYALQDSWIDKGMLCHVEANSYRAIDDESMRSVEKDIPMMALAFCVMGIASALYFSNFKNIVQSRSVLGLGAVATVLMSIMTTYGFLFCLGVPMTSVAQLFPYVMLGIGLDDTFIVTGAYSRTDPEKPVLNRIEVCVNEVAISIVVSTLTTVVAFSLGIATSMPMIRWFCMYAAPTVAIDFIYQITFFIAILVLDEKRIQNDRYDCLVCLKSRPTSFKHKGDDIEKKKEEDEDKYGQKCNNLEKNSEKGTSNSSASTVVSKWMCHYSNFLMRPVTKVLVFFSFTGLLILGVLGALQQKQELDFRSIMPADSFIRTYFDAIYQYSNDDSFALTYLRADIFFRGVDVSLPDIQQQMLDFVDELVEMPYITSPPEYFWLRDFHKFQKVFQSNYTELTNNMSFNDQLTLFLDIPNFDLLYSKDIVRDEKSGDVIASRCQVIFDKGSNYDVAVQIATVREQYRITSHQAVNIGKSEWSFFMFTEHFYAWELHDLMYSELLLSFALGILSVFMISVLFIPHPLLAIVLPLIVSAVYVELMAFLYAVGIYINVITAIGLLMSLGLVVDYNMHVALTYYETSRGVITARREECIDQTLQSMGGSVLVGASTTMLAALPLVLTSSLAFRTFFWTFLAIPVLGAAHGLILLPVILSLWGPKDCTCISARPRISLSITSESFAEVAF